MAETPDKTEVFFEHPGWLFVIIPVQAAYTHYSAGTHNATTSIPPTFPLYAAYCKRCNTYYTQPLNFSHTYDYSGTINLPKYGCVGPE